MIKQSASTWISSWTRLAAMASIVATVAMASLATARADDTPPPGDPVNGKRVYLAGDTEETPELKNLPNIDIAFIPMNLPYTQTAEAAAQWVKDFKPKIVYPYHTQGMPSGDVNVFAAAVGNASEVRLRKWY